MIDWSIEAAITLVRHANDDYFAANAMHATCHASSRRHRQASIPNACTTESEAKVTTLTNRAALLFLSAISLSAAGSASAAEIFEPVAESCRGMRINDLGEFTGLCTRPYEGLVRVPLHGQPSYIRSPDPSCDVRGIANNGTVFVQCADNSLQRGYLWLPQQTTLLPLQPVIGHERATVNGFSSVGVVVGTTVDRNGNAYPALWRNPIGRPTELKVGLLGTLGEGCVAVGVEDDNAVDPAVVGSCPNQGSDGSDPVVWRRDSLLATYQAHRLKIPRDMTCIARFVSADFVVGTCADEDEDDDGNQLIEIAVWQSDTMLPRLLENSIPGGDPFLVSYPIGVSKDGAIAGSADAASHGQRPLVWRPLANDLTLYKTAIDPTHPERNIIPLRYNSGNAYLFGFSTPLNIFRLNTSTGHREDLGAPAGYSAAYVFNASRSGCYFALEAFSLDGLNRDAIRARVCP